ncbi:YheC/YheD family protein [Bacillus salacetis]|uniref:YheC/YheD family endospore coat-associated protein n=1 Tax=Bacillus salacetis TaxID=2315464 RepID=UPI003BA1CCBD
MLFRFEVSKTNIDQPVLHIPESASQDLRTFTDETIFIRIGNSQIEARIDAKTGTHDVYELLIPPGYPLQLSGCRNFNTRFSKKIRTLFLGPVITVLTDMDSSGKPMLGRLEQYYDEVCRFADTHGGLFCLTCPTLLNRQTGYIFNEEKREWSKSSIPLPDLLYNRIHSRKSDMDIQVRTIIADLEEKSVFVFNTSYLTKEYVYELLSQEDHFLEYLPHTEIFSFSNLRRLLEFQQDLFIKHIAGSQGKKLLRLTYLENEYRLIQNLGNESVQNSFSSFNETAEELAKLKVSSNFIIQETIDLLKSDERSLDFRFLCHLVDHREWKLISAVARISGDGQFVSNLAQGGELAKPLSVLGEFFSPAEALRIYRLMEELAVSVCSRLAENSPLTLGELGVDLGVDETGKPWLIEVNSKPSKQTYTENNTIRPSVKALYTLSKNTWEERRASYDQTGNHDAGT